ncbi:MAG: Na/Pi cotransporter family protein [Geminicoccaceae bacterium]
MPITRAVIDLLGEVALLLWGLHMVSSGVLRAFGGDLRHVLARALGNRLTALAAGLVVTLALQSSTATALMTGSFAATGVIGPVSGLAVMLGANVGTALVTALLAFDGSLLFPVLLLAGLVRVRSTSSARGRHMGRALLGLGMMLLALHLLAAAFALDHLSDPARELLAVMGGEPLLVLILAAATTWLLHSSIVTVLVVATLAQAGLVDTAPALAMVLGANLGSALNPLVDALGSGPAALRLALGNLLNRLCGCLLCLPLLGEIAALAAASGSGGANSVVLSHLAFNVVLAALFILPLPMFPGLLTRLLPDRPSSEDPAAPRYLDRETLRLPTVALAAAARETLRMADVVEAMLRGSGELLTRDDGEAADRLRALDNVLDRLHREVKLFLGELGRTGLGAAERRRLAWILVAAQHLEHAGDAVDKGLLDLLAKRIRRRQQLSDDELAEAETMLEHVLAQLRLATAVLIGEDLDAARRLVEQKERFRELERTAMQAQFARIQSGPVLLETDALHLDLVRELRRIEAHVAAIAHPLLERRNLLRPSRLVVEPEPAAQR